MSMESIILLMLAVCSGIAVCTKVLLDRRWQRHSGLSRAIYAGVFPSALILLVLVVGDIMWRLGHDPQNAYSPLAFLLFGFPLFAFNLSLNLVVAGLVRLK